jgi:CBS domain containing-hemolysin-like protein
MIILGAFLLLVFSGVVALSSYYYLLYVESLRLRPRGARSFEYFSEHLRPALKLNPEEGLRRFAVARQVGLVFLSLDLMFLTLREQTVGLALLEAIILSLGALVAFVHIIPSILFTRTSGAWAARLVGPARVIGWMAQPVVVLTGFVSSLAELSADELSDEKTSSASDDIEALLDVGEEEGLIGQEDRKLIQSVVEFGDKTVREVMTPRPQIVAIDVNSSLEDLRQLFVNEEYSRIPVYEGSIDTILGFIHSRDTLDLDEEDESTTALRELLRPLPMVPDTKPIHELLREMQEGNHQMAIVIDEYGHTTGLATMEDMMEEIVGEIRDESEPDPDVIKESADSFVVSGNLDLDRLEELAGFRPDDDFESTTIGGLVTEQLGHVPPKGAKVRLDGIEIEVLAADQRHVKSLRVRRLSEEEGEANSARGDKSPQERATREGAA